MGSFWALFRRRLWLDLAGVCYSVRNIPYVVIARPVFVGVMTIAIWGTVLATYLALRALGEDLLAGLAAAGVFVYAFFLMSISGASPQHWRHGQSIASEGLALRRRLRRQTRTE